MKKKMIIAVAAAAMLALAGNPVLADWEKANGIWSYTENGQKAADTWKQIRGKWYYFDKSGKMQSGWVQSKGKWYYLDPENGDMKEGWVQDGESWYYLNSGTGEMATGWKNTGEKWYFLDSSGCMQTGIVDVGGKIYSLDENGAMQTGTVLLRDELQNVGFYTFDAVTGEAVGNNVPIPSKAYSLEGRKQEELSSSVKAQIQMMQEKKEERASQNNNSSDDRDAYSPTATIVRSTKISEITVPGSGEVDVVLSEAVELDISDFYIRCPAGKDMTILKVETETGSRKNKVYHLTTSFFSDNTYYMEITLPSGRTIEKKFVTSLSAPEIKDIETRRVDENTAQVSFISDSAGMLYYMVVPVTVSRQTMGGQAPQTGQEVQKNGVAVKLGQQGIHSLTLKDLKADQAYTIYLATALEENDTAVLRGSSLILGQPQGGENTGEMAIVEADATSNSRIKFVLNKPTSRALTLEDIDVKCTKGDVHIGGIQTEDNKTYYISMQANWFMNSKTGYTVYVTLPDGNKSEKKFYTDFDYPNLNEKVVRRIAEDEIEVRFRSDEGGVFYYGTAENPDASQRPTVDEVIKSGVKANLSGGENRLKVKINKGDKLFYLVPVDLKGNRPPMFSEYVIIPDEIQEPEPEPEKGNEIENIACSTNSIGYHRLTVTMKEVLDSLAIPKESIKIYPQDGQSLATQPMVTERGETWNGLNIFYIQYNIKFPNGRYELEFLYDGAYYTKEFEIK